MTRSHTSVDLDWTSILPLNGSKQDAFEELCVQLARASCSAESEFIRKGRPDSGVEAHVVHPDGMEWAWQAKYFDAMKSSQWGQLDESVETALTGHPKLTRFIICVPLDLPDGRRGRSKSARQHWNERVAKWSGWAADAGMSVEFVWHGSHELLTALASPQHEHLVRFFFGNRFLDDAWFRKRLSEAHEAAGPRYTPELNVKLSLYEYFDAFGRSHEFFNGVRAKARRISERMRNHAFELVKDPDTTLQGKIAAARSACNCVLEDFKVLSEDPVHPDPLEGLCASLDEAVRCVSEVLSESRRQRATAKAALAGSAGKGGTHQDGSDDSYSLRELYTALDEALGHVDQFRSIVCSNFVILTGEAGSGKTHLLCDLAQQRLDRGRPTVVLMGQRFLETSDPWIQALQQLDIAGWSAQDLVQALEVVAQRANSRVLIIIDAINEGAGRQLWPVHLSAFLGRLRESRWINTIISVRSTYVDDLLPEGEVQGAVWLEHRGFENVEFDATRVFFEHFGIDFPSTPLLAPEFSNPLYLKTLCSGLKASGQSRLPRGFHGVVKAFSQYIAGINKKVARDIDYDVRHDHVTAALNDLAGRMVERQTPWVSYGEAESLINGRLPGRDYSRSLLARLLGEGLLIEEKAWSEAARCSVSVVQIAYERLSDYLCVESLLDRYLVPTDASAAFRPGGPLDLDALHATWWSQGFHEALHILVAERTGHDLISLVPSLAKKHFTPRIFLNSLVWRDPAAVTSQSVAYLRRLKKTDTEDVIDTLITLATIPDHPLNAYFTDQWLRESDMADRDAWWTIGLHGLWMRQSAITRLLHWSERLWPHMDIADEPAWLSACVVTWLLSSSNRFIRDQATKSLVRILTWRPRVIAQLIEHFYDVDDAYVVERMLAAAYGAAMRTTDATGVEAVADQTYAKVFAAGKPRPHLLLREYAQGIVKRAEYLRKKPDAASWPKANPPFASDWPTIPTDSEIEVIAPAWPGDKSKAFSWGHHRIRSSVMDDDFGRYVIGTNSWSTNWLSLRLDEPQWISLDLQIERAVATLNHAERQWWDAFRQAERTVSMERFGRRWKIGGLDSDEPDDEAVQSPSVAEKLLGKIRDRLLGMLSTEKAAIFSVLMDATTNDSRASSPPKFDLKLVQRYVVGRVFELGWTTERFGEFDQHMPDRGRDAGKPERIGKKYQWIAYHEMLAFMADHYQYAAGSRQAEIGTAYQGSWQDNVRDIDPSNVMEALMHDEDQAHSVPGFWASTGVHDWHGDLTATSWAGIVTDIPRPEDLLFRRDELSCSDWVNLHTDMKWSMRRPAYEDSFRDGRREIWIHADGALVPRAEISELKRKEIAREINGRGVHSGGLHEIFLGEIGWSEASKFFDDPYFSHLGWAGDIDPDVITVIAASQGYTREKGGLDCSVTSETISLRVPTKRMLGLLRAEWGGIAATYINERGSVLAFDPSANSPGPSAFLVRCDTLQELLRTHDLAVCWVIQGEKVDAAGSPNYRVHARRSFHGAFVWDGVEMSGDYSFDKIESLSEED